MRLLDFEKDAALFFPLLQIVSFLLQKFKKCFLEVLFF